MSAGSRSSGFFFFSSRRRHTRWTGDWSSDVCSSDLQTAQGNFTPAIHNLGAVSSYSTLVLIDGHRFAYGGATTVLPDAGVLPPDAIERIEVLADAASSGYGSDAVAGVINLVTRKNFS